MDRYIDILERICTLLRKENTVSLTTESSESVNKQEDKGDTSDISGFPKSL